MNKFIPLDKRSKKEQKKFHSMQRHDWNGLNPATRITPNGKGYDRNKIKDEERKRNCRSFEHEPAVFYIKLFCMFKYLKSQARCQIIQHEIDHCNRILL